MIRYCIEKKLACSFPAVDFGQVFQGVRGVSVCENGGGDRFSQTVQNTKHVLV